MLRCFVCIISAGLAIGPSGPLGAQDDKTWRDEQLKQLRGRWTTFQEQKVRRRVDLEFSESKVTVFVFDESGRKRLSEDDIQAYIGSGEWRGKAGGYAMQGIAGSFVVKLVGSYTNVVGLPLYETTTLLGGEGFPVRFGWLSAAGV